MLAWGVGCAVGLLLGQLFFRSALCAAVSLAGGYSVRRVAADEKETRKRRELTGQLRVYLLSVTTLLRSGYALENAMMLAGREAAGVFGGESMMAQEAKRFETHLRLKLPPEKLWEDLQRRSGLREAGELAGVFAVAKKQGGDYLPVLKAMAEAMEARRLVREETVTALTGQRTEFIIMCAMPPGILLYLNLAAPELADKLYSAAAGRFTMLLSLVFYAAAAVWGRKILEEAGETEK